MGIIFEIIGAMGPLLVVVLIIGIIVALNRNRDVDEGEPGIGTIRRLYYYGSCFVSLMVAAAGVILLLDFLADRLFGPRVLSGGEVQLAMGIALSIVGILVWILHWRLVERSVASYQYESRTNSRKIYIYLVMGVAAVFGAAGLVSMLRWAIAGAGFDGTHIASPVVWGALWASHWKIDLSDWGARASNMFARRTYTYFTSFYGLILLSVGVGVFLAQLLNGIYNAIFSTDLLSSGTDFIFNSTNGSAASVAVVGGVYWMWHWHRMSKGDMESLLRQIYLYMFAILGSAIITVGSISGFIFGVLKWFTVDTSAASHFGFLPSLIAVMITGGSVWIYHFAVVRQETPLVAGGLLGSRRVYRYLLASLGLLTLSFGLVTLFSIFLDILFKGTSPVIAGTDGSWTPIIAAVTLLATGTPLWAMHWFEAQRNVVKIGIEERNAASRRIFIFGIFGIAVLISLINLSWFLFIVLQDLLTGSLSFETIHDAKWNIGMLLMAGTISIYYWLILKEDRQLIEHSNETYVSRIPLRVAITVVASESAWSFVQALRDRVGVDVKQWKYIGGKDDAPVVSDENIDKVEASLASMTEGSALVIIDGKDIKVIQYM